MVIISTFAGDQKAFNRAWCPLMYKHQECQFFITAGPTLVRPKDLNNLHVNAIDVPSGPILKCSIDIIPTYRGMIELQKKSKDWIGSEKDLGEHYFYVLGQLL